VQLAELLKDGIRPSGPFWEDPLQPMQPQVWDSLARQNPIHAAIAADDDAGERQRSHRTTDFLLHNLKDGVIVDVGCGYGRIAKWLLPRRCFQGYIGVDGSTTMLRQFWNRYITDEAEQRTPLLLIRSPVDTLHIRDGSADNVIVSAVILHNPKTVAPAIVAEIHRVLKTGGKAFFLADCPNRLTLSGLQGQLDLSALQFRGQGHRNGPVRYYSRREVEALFSWFEGFELRHSGFIALPKEIIGLPRRLNLAYRRRLHEPVQRRVEPRLSAATKRRHCHFLEVVATK
jgi:SAM-dependent methyltransferase